MVEAIDKYDLGQVLKIDVWTGDIVAKYATFRDIPMEKGLELRKIMKCCLGQMGNTLGYAWKIKKSI